MRCLLSLLVLLTAAPALAFEGEIEARTFGAGSDEDLKFTIYVSAKRDVRMDAKTLETKAKDTKVKDTKVKERHGKVRRLSYVKPAAGKYDYMIDHEKKQAAKIPKSAVAGLTKNAQSSAKETDPNVEVEKLGSATIAGQSTRHVRVTDKGRGEVSEFWLSDRYPAELWRSVFSFDASKSQSPTSDWARIAERDYDVEPGFIMKMMSKDKHGKQQGIEVTRMQEKKVTADKFVIPAGYEVMTMPDVPAGTAVMKQPSSKEEAEKMRDEWMQKLRQQQ